MRPQQGRAELDKVDTNKDGVADLAELTHYMKHEIYDAEERPEIVLTDADLDEKVGRCVSHNQLAFWLQAAEDAKEYLDELDINRDHVLVTTNAIIVSWFVL